MDKNYFVGNQRMEMKFRTTSGGIISANPMAEQCAPLGLADSAQVAMPYSETGLSDYEEPLISAVQVQQLLQELPLPVGRGLQEMLNAVLSAQAPAPFSEALGELEAYLAALEVTEALPFEQQIQLKAFVMQGWKSWRSSFQLLSLPDLANE
ncbi:hypothetical protein [Stutzerimonas stutzeri]|uniref:hypothetical protein n=1 Tax=Stutzerimonas stutzeri TaxID=316 RepID=UPI0015E2C1FE|nr:hypothetical protein [Stutzerimonas stutzeri]MBA1280300.1 hypothetical protein [Stutzerimonas stutzeri]